MMKSLKIILIILAICWLGVLGWFVVLPYLGWGLESASNQVPESQVVTVRRGDLRTDITAVGNLAFSRKEDLAFEMAGDVEEVLVEEGETVEEGQVVARLGTSEWEKEMATLERSVLQAKVKYTNAIVALEETESEAYTADLKMEIKQQQLEQAQQQYWEALIRYDYGKISEADLLSAMTNLERAEAALAAVTTDPLQIEAKRLQIQLEEANLKDAEKELAEARESSPEVKAPFAGFITKVNVEGGDEIKKGTVAVTLADPTKFEAEITVSEMDFPQVKLGGEASAQVDAMPGLSLSAKVTHISPSATIQSGVVNYKVKVEVQSLQAVMQEREQARQEAMPEQPRQEGGGRQAMPTMIPEDFQLSEGLTVTVSIITDERKDVLLVPNQAITQRGTQTLVQVLKDGRVEERSITVGMSNWQYTEVTGGLSEGEKVVLPETTTTTPTTPTTPQQRQPGGITPIPGMPRMR